MDDSIRNFIIYEKRAPYELFIEQMERIGLVRLPSHLNEKDIDISDDDEAIHVTAKDCQSLSIRGISESKLKRKLLIDPHKIYLKIFDNGGIEIRPEDAIQLSITEKKFGLDLKDSRIIYYYYPYKTVQSGLKIKKGIVITKDRRLEIRVIRDGKPIKIGKIEVDICCDKWLRKK